MKNQKFATRSNYEDVPGNCCGHIRTELGEFGNMEFGVFNPTSGIAALGWVTALGDGTM